MPDAITPRLPPSEMAPTFQGRRADPRVRVGAAMLCLFLATLIGAAEEQKNREVDGIRNSTTLTSLTQVPEVPEAGPAPGLTISSIGEFWALSPEQRRQPLAYQFECTVLHYDADPSWNMLWVRDETGGAYVDPGRRPLPIRTGQRIRVSGTCRSAVERLSFENASVVVLGESPIVPQALGDWREYNPHLADRVVWAEGLVDRQTTSPTDLNHFRLFLSVDGRLVVAWVLVQPGAPIPQWVGSLVRVSGIYNPQPATPGPLTSLELLVSSLDRVEVIGHLDSDPRFHRPAVPIEALRDLPEDGFVRVVGEVSSQQPGRSLELRDATGQVDVITPQTLVMAVHERVEAFGRPRVDGLSVRLEGGLFRRVVHAHPEALAAGPAVAVPDTLFLAANILDLAPEEAAQGLPARVTGVVTWAHPGHPYFYLQDSSGGVRVRRGPDPKELAKTGRSIEATGRTVMGAFAPEILADKIQRIGVIALPEAPMVSLEHALTGVEEAQWVAMSGYFRAVEKRTDAAGREEQVLQLATAAGDFEGLLATGENVAGLVGAVIRVRGVCRARVDAGGRLNGIQVLIPDASFLQVEEPVPEDVFKIPTRGLASLGRFATTQAFSRRVKVEGTVLYAAGGRFVVHEGGSSLVALTRETRLPRPGSRVEAVGFLGRQGPRVVLRETVYRETGTGAYPAAAPDIDPAKVDPANDAQLVEVSGTVLDSSYVATTLGMTIQQGAAVFPAYLEGAGYGVETGSRVRLTGVYDVRFDEYGEPRSFGLLLRGPGDMAVLARPSWFTARRILLFTTGLALITALVIAWVVALRRRVALQTEQIRVQLQRENRLQGELERALRLESLGLLAGGIAHDFNNLLTVVMGNISLARFDPGLDAENRESLGEAELAVSRARDLTQQLLTFSKGGAPIRAAVDLAGVVREVTQFVLHGSNVRPEFAFAADLRPADVDRGQIGQVVQNIVLNGAQAMPDGGTIQVILMNEEVIAGMSATLAPGPYLRLDITDQGRGISAEDLPRIFDPYFTTKRQGSGLGLATVYSIIQRHGGDITVDSSIGTGTTFRVRLPAASVPASAPAAPAKPEKVRERAMDESRPRRVLIMDDEESIRRLSQTILRRAGYEAVSVADGADAVRAYMEAQSAGRPYDLVIFDLTVPGGMGGRHAMEALLKIDPAVKAIVSSGYSNDPTLSDHRAFGFAAVVAKPYEIAVLLETVQAVLRGGSE